MGCAEVVGMRLRYYSLRPGVPIRKSAEELTLEERGVLVSLGMLEEKWIVLSEGRELYDGFYEEEEELVIWVEPPDMGTSYVLPPAFDPDLIYAASKGLVLFPFQDIGVEKMLEL